MDINSEDLIPESMTTFMHSPLRVWDTSKIVDNIDTSPYQVPFTSPLRVWDTSLITDSIDTSPVTVTLNWRQRECPPTLEEMIVSLPPANEGSTGASAGGGPGGQAPQ